MGRDTAKYLLMILCLMLVQILICNRIMLFSVAVPIIFFYPILRLPMSLSVKWVLTIAFLMGFVVDIFSDTPGVNTISCTVLAVVRRPVFHSYTGNDEELAGVSPCIGVLGFWTLFKYLIVCTPIYCVLAIGLEYFSFVNLQRTLCVMAASSFLSFILLLGIDALTGSKSKTFH